jgi:hypothetical protein
MEPDFKEQVILGYSQKLELYQLLDLDAAGEVVDGEEESSMFQWMRQTRKFYFTFLKYYITKYLIMEILRTVLNGPQMPLLTAWIYVH